MKPTAIYVGTSGWTYDDWAGVFYPKDLKAADRLAFYTRVFNTLEINATFYRLPSQAMIAGWNRKLPSRFHLAVKGSRAITHLKKLDDCGDLVEAFFSRVGQLSTLRVVLWQLPPSLAKDIDRLDRFLGLLPGKVRHAIEFRHASWWDMEVAAVLARHQAAMVAVSHPTLPEAIHATTDFVYLRFHGRGKEMYRYDYSREELADWAARTQPLLAGRTLYAFFNNTYQAIAPRNAALFAELLHPIRPGRGESN